MDRIYIVTDRKLAGERFFEIISNLLKEGYTFIQIRENDLNAIELCRMVEKILSIANDNINLIMNDRVDIAHIYNLFGVQLKEVSTKPELVKRYFPHLKIGLSIHDETRINDNIADFYVFGNVFDTKCKPGTEGKGLSFLRKIVSLTKKPVYAIGGINVENTIKIKESGAYGVAIRSLVFDNSNYLKDLEKIRKNLELK